MAGKVKQKVPTAKKPFAGNINKQKAFEKHMREKKAKKKVLAKRVKKQAGR